MNPITHLACLVLPVVLLAACGGSGNSGGNSVGIGSNYLTSTTSVVSRSFPLNSATARTIAGGGRPTNRTSAQLSMIAADISEEADTLIGTDLALSTQGGHTEFDTTCTAGGCMVPVVISGVASIVEAGITAPTFGNFPGFSFSAQPVMTRRGVETVQAVSGNLLQETHRTQLTYAGWLDGSIFGLSVLRLYQGGDLDRRLGLGFSVGRESGTNPMGTGSATWNGLMIGGTKQADQFIQGDAAIDIDDLASPDVDILFSNIRNLSTGSNVSDMMWNDLAVTDGRFNSTTNGEIEGSFYGATHQEVGGAFDRAGFIGGFGANRVPTSE